MTTNFSEQSYVLSKRVRITPVADLPLEIAKRLGAEDGEAVISLKGSRWSSQKLSGEMWDLVSQFEHERTIPEAVLAHARAFGLEPEQVLQSAYDDLKMLVKLEILVDPASIPRESIGVLHQPGDVVGSYRILERVQISDDTEVYKAIDRENRRVAIKYSAPSSSGYDQRFENEIATLKRLHSFGMQDVPSLIEYGSSGSNSYIVSSWCEGLDLDDWIDSTDNSDFRKRIRVALNICRTVGKLHSIGTLHGDLNPRNFVVGKDERVFAIDFGNSVGVDDTQSSERAGVFDWYEPEALLVEKPNGALGASTLLGEQYVVAALVYKTLTGNHYLKLSFQKELAKSQVLSEQPCAIEPHGLAWPAGDQVLKTALSKEPRDRYSNVFEFVDALEEAVNSFPLTLEPSGKVLVGLNSDRSSDSLNSLQAELMRKTGYIGNSIMTGAAGVAYAALRSAVALRSGQHLSLSEYWLSKLTPMSEVREVIKSSTSNRELSVFHGISGELLVRTYHAFLLRDETSFEECTDHLESVIQVFLEQSNAPVTDPTRAFLDTLNGAPGLLLALSDVRDLSQKIGGRTTFEAKCEKLANLISTRLSERNGNEDYHGFAHGTAGILFSMLKWYGGSAIDRKEFFSSQIDRHLCFLERFDDALCWPITREQGDARYWTGWCNGAAGQLLLFNRLYSVFEDEYIMQICLGLAKFIWRNSGHSGSSLCCGSIGEAIAILQWSSKLKENQWCVRGEQYAWSCINRSGEISDRNGLFTGSLSNFSFACEVERGVSALFPVCDSFIIEFDAESANP